MENKEWIVVTGASSGIGEETAKLLLQKGYGVITTGRNKEKLEELYSSNPNAMILPWNLSELDSIKKYIKEASNLVGAIKGLVHCAGIDYTSPINLIKEKQLVEVFSINTFASMLLVSGFSKKNMTLDKASFVLISSLAAHEGAYAKSIYAASKGAIEGFLQSAAPELAEKSIRINAVAPGIVKTRMVEQNFSQMTEEQVTLLTKDYPLGIGEPIDIAKLVEFLISDKSQWITGQTIVADGGHLFRKC